MEKLLTLCSDINYTKAPATKENCADCGASVFLSESTLLAAQQHHPTCTKNDLHIVCLKCALPIIQKHGADIKPAKITDRQIKEIRQGILYGEIEKNKN